MTDKLSRIIVRLRRADEHLDLFDTKVGIKPSGVRAYGVRRETNDDGSKHTYYGVVEEGLADTLSSLVSDCLHNLRATLDNLVFRLAELNLGGPVPLSTQGSIAFPIASSSTNFQNAISAHRLAGISGVASTLIERFQPYNRTNTPFGSALTSLRELQDIDKHRFLIRVAVDIGDYLTHVTPVGYSVEGMGLEGLFLPEGLKNNAPLAFFFVDPPSNDVDVEFDPHPAVVFDQGPVGGTDPSSLLHLIRAEIGNIVSDAAQLYECL